MFLSVVWQKDLRFYRKKFLPTWDNIRVAAWALVTPVTAAIAFVIL